MLLRIKIEPSLTPYHTSVNISMSMETTLTIRGAEQRDSKDILEIIKILDLSYPSQTLDDFWVAEKDGKIAGIANLKEFDDFLFLSSVGTKEEFQRQGISSALLNNILSGAGKCVYLYTVIPKFFEKLGFRRAAPLPGLPAKKIFSCRECTPEACACMVR